MASAVFDRLESLNQSTTNWKIKVRVTRTWPSVTVESGSLKGFNLILLDDDNNHVHAFAYHNIWNALTTTIVEGSVYIIDQFTVKDAIGSLKPVQAKKQIRFTSSTTVEAAEDDSMIPSHKFEFLDLSDLLAEATKYELTKNHEFAIDVIGVIEEYESVKRIGTKYGDRDIVKFRLCDLNNAHMVSVWGDLALSVEEMMAQENKKPTIAIITSTKLSVFMNSVQIGTLASSKIYINLNDESVTDMRTRLENEKYETKALHFFQAPRLEPIPTFFEKLSLRELNEKLTYEHMKKRIVCTFKVIKIDEDSSWWFYSCNKCKSAVQSIDTRFKCEECPRIIPVANKRFQIMVLAEDSTFACNIVLMDRAARRILGTSAAKLFDDLKKVPEEGLPKVLSSIVGSEISVVMSLTKANIIEDSTLFYADDIFDITMLNATASISPHVSECSTVDLTTESCESDNMMQTPGTAKSVTKKIKTEA